MTRIGVLTGGGDVPGLNPCIKTLVYAAADRGYEVVGLRRGWAGLLDWAMRPQLAQLGFLREDEATIAAAERTGIYSGPAADEWEAAARDVPTSRAVVTDSNLPRPGVRQPG